MSQKMSNNTEEKVGFPGRLRPQYHYFYGTTDSGADNVTVNTSETHEQESLIGEVLVPTDNEEETVTNNEHDLQHLFISDGDSTKHVLSSLQPFEKESSGGLGRALSILLFVASMSTFFIVFVPNSAERIPQTQSIVVPFPIIDRADYGDPVKDLLDLNLFHPSLFSDEGQRTFRFPFPTGAFWTNLVVPSPDPKYSYPIVVYPYAYKWSEASLQLSYPAAHRFEDQNHHWIADKFVPELTISTKEKTTSRYVTKFDPFSVSLSFVATQESSWETILVQGSPYSTMKYVHATPVFRALSTFKSVQCPGDEAEDFHDFLDDGQESRSGHRQLFGVCVIDQEDGNFNMRGVQFMFSSQEGAYWILFASEPVTLEFDSIQKTELRSTAPFTGTMRLAYIPAKNVSDISTFASTGLRRLIYHAGTYPVGSKVDWEFHSQTTYPSVKRGQKTNITTSSRHGTLRFTFSVQSMTDNSLRPNAGSTGLLMLALPHHTQVLPKSQQLSSKRFDLNYQSIKGLMTPIVGSEWSYDEPLLDLEFDMPSQRMDPAVRGTIIRQVREDMTRVLPTLDENIYGFGKQVARLAQLVHIAAQLESQTAMNKDEDSNSTLTQEGSAMLLSYMESFLTGKVTDHLVFDGNLGGLVSLNGLSDKGADFGNGRYNDHHFHYGYILYAAAILANVNPAFVERFGSYIDTIFHDVVHSANGDSESGSDNRLFLPMSRHKSWFDGHSFATGLFAFGDGKSQESSSESVNCYYGAYLWSLVRHGNGNVGSDLTDFARLLFAMEVRGAKTYWHMVPDQSRADPITIYSKTFRENYMVGNVGMLDVAANTWFGNDPLYVHMINAIPITSATAILFDRDYVRSEYEYLIETHAEVEMAWRGYTVAIHAIVDPNEAWNEARDLVSYELDAAISKSQVMYWICQQVEFNSTSKTSDLEKPVPSKSISDSSACGQHFRCVEAAMTGHCCPTIEGMFLGCCSAQDDKGNYTTANTTTETFSDSEMSCASHSMCVQIGLTGSCCPTLDGVFLGCCST